MPNSSLNDSTGDDNPKDDSDQTDQDRNRATQDPASPEQQRELDDTLRSLKDLITDPAQAADDAASADSLQMADASTGEDVPTLTHVVHDPDDVQRDIFEQIAFDQGVLSKETSAKPAPVQPPLTLNEETTPPSASPEKSDDRSGDDPISSDRDFAADADRFAAENFSNPEPGEPLPEVDAQAESAPDYSEDNIPVVTAALDAKALFPDGAFDGPELDEYAGDTLPGGFLPGSVDNRPYEDFGIDELPGEDDAATMPVPGARETIWDDRRPDSFVRTADDVANDAVGLVKDSLSAAGEKPLNPEIAAEIQKALAGMLEQWHDADTDTPPADPDAS